MQDERYSQQQPQHRTSSATKHHHHATQHSSSSKREQFHSMVDQRSSQQTSKQKLMNHNNVDQQHQTTTSSMVTIPSTNKDSSKRVTGNHNSTGKHNSSKAKGNNGNGNKQQSQEQNNSLLNATLMAMINQKHQQQKQTQSSTKNNQHSRSKQTKSSGGTSSIAGKKVRAKSACKGNGIKAELFNSTAPIKFFSNLEETVREITTGNFKQSSSKGRQSNNKINQHNRQREERYNYTNSSSAIRVTTTANAIEEQQQMMHHLNHNRKNGIHSGAQQINVSKIQQRPPSAATTIHTKRTKGLPPSAENTQSNNKQPSSQVLIPIKVVQSTTSAATMNFQTNSLTEQANTSFNVHTTTIPTSTTTTNAQVTSESTSQAIASAMENGINSQQNNQQYQGDYVLAHHQQQLQQMQQVQQILPLSITTTAKSKKVVQSSNLGKTNNSSLKMTSGSSAAQGHGTNPASNTQHQLTNGYVNSKIKLRVQNNNQQKTRSTSSISNNASKTMINSTAAAATKNNFNNHSEAYNNRTTSFQQHKQGGSNRLTQQIIQDQENNNSNSSQAFKVSGGPQPGGMASALSTGTSKSKTGQKTTSKMTDATQFQTGAINYMQQSTSKSRQTQNLSALQQSAEINVNNNKLQMMGIEKDIVANSTGGAKINKSFSGTTTAASKKQRQTLKGMIEGLTNANNIASVVSNNVAAAGSSIPGSSSKRKSSHSQYLANSMNVKGGSKRQQNAQFNYGGASVLPMQQESQTTKNKDKMIYSSYNYQSNGSDNKKSQVNGVHGQHQVSGTSKISSSLSQLPKSKKIMNNSQLLFNSTSKKLGIAGSSTTGNGNMLPQFARVDFDRLNNRKTDEPGKNMKQDNQPSIQPDLTMQSYQDIKQLGDVNSNLLNQSHKGLGNCTQKAFLSNSNRLNLRKDSTQRSIEDSSGYFATCQTSGPLNPFLEQILREIPNAYSGNVSGLNSAGVTGTLNLAGLMNKDMGINFNIQGQSSNKASGGSKKTLGKISKKIRSNMNIGNMQKDQISNTFNLTTKAAALIAASDKNAAAFMNIETKTFESRNSNSVSGITTKQYEQNSGALNSSKKHQNLNKTVNGGKTSQSLVGKKIAQMNNQIQQQRVDQKNMGHIRLTSNKHSSKSSYSCSQKRQRDQIKQQDFCFKNNQQQTQATKGDSNVIEYSNSNEAALLNKETNEFQQNNSSSKFGSQPKLTLAEKQVGSQASKIGSLMNVVKVAAKQKEGKLNSTFLNQKLNLRQKQQQYQLNTTQVLEDKLLQLKLAGNNKSSLPIPQKTKAQSKSRGALNSSTGNLQSNKQLINNKRSPSLQQERDQAVVVKESQQTQPHPLYSNDILMKQQRHGNKKQMELKSKLSQRQQKNKGKTNEPQNRKSNCLKFDWSGFLSNLMHENFKPKKSTSGPGNTNASALCERPYQLQQDMQNKTQPLPKNLIQKESPQHDAYDMKNKAVIPNPAGTTYGAPHLHKTESRGSEYRPRIGRKQIEIAPPNGVKPNFAATMNHSQLKGATAAAIQAITVLTEVTDTGETDKDEVTSAPSTHRSPDKVNEDYKFGRILGEGAYAVVRLAYKKSEGKNYAAKIYDKSKLVDEHRRNSVCREVMLMQKLKHPNVVKFQEAFETDHYVYLIIEYVSGKCLHDFLKKQRASPTSKTEFDQTVAEDEAKRIIQQLLECLDSLHEAGITHRDIKLENILLDQDQNVKIIDFGFSTSYKPQRKLKMFCGTPSYMAPEIVSRTDYYGPPADIWATGVLLFCLLNGFFPFKGQTDAELYRKINRGAFKMIRSDLSDDCQNILKEMFNINPDSRMTASELLRENWFLTDSTKKRSMAEIRREFKAKILKKFPVRAVNKTICIPAPLMNNLAGSSQQNDKNLEEEKVVHNDDKNNNTTREGGNGSNVARKAELIAQNSLAIYRNVNQASPPSMYPPETQATHPDAESFEELVIGNQLQSSEDGSNDEQINHEALLAYYNTSGVQSHPQASAPPSGKFTLTPYSAYNQLNVHRSPPSMADVMSQNGVAEGNQSTVNNPRGATNIADDANQTRYNPMPYMNDLSGKEPLEAADVEIIIQGKPPLRNSQQYGDFSEYRDAEDNKFMLSRTQPLPSKQAKDKIDDLDEIYGMGVPANIKQ